MHKTVLRFAIALLLVGAIVLLFIYGAPLLEEHIRPLLQGGSLTDSLGCWPPYDEIILK